MAERISEEVEESLTSWLLEYLGNHQVKEEVIDYAYDYWIYWLNKLAEFLQKPIESRKALHEWFIL